MSRQHHRDLVAWLEGQGAAAVRVERHSQRGHPKLCFAFRGKDYRFPVSATSGDRKATLAMQAVLRHELGLVREHHAGQRRRKEKPAQRGPGVTATAPAPVRVDSRRPLNRPFLALGALLERAS